MKYLNWFIICILLFGNGVVWGQSDKFNENIAELQSLMNKVKGEPGKPVAESLTNEVKESITKALTYDGETLDKIETGAFNIIDIPTPTKNFDKTIQQGVTIFYNRIKVVAKPDINKIKCDGKKDDLIPGESGNYKEQFEKYRLYCALEGTINALGYFPKNETIVEKKHCHFYEYFFDSKPQCISDVTSEILKLKSREEASLDSFKGLKKTVWVGIILSVLALLTSILLPLLLALKNRKEKEKKAYIDSMATRPEHNTGDEEGSNIQQFVSKAEYDELLKRVKELESQKMVVTTQKTQYKSQPDTQINTPPIPPPPQTPTQEIMYTPAPRNGLFISRQFSKEQKVGKHFYKINVINDRTAEYTLVSDQDTITKAFKVRDTYITPAFEIEGKPSSKDYRVKIKGKLSKDGANWRIADKGVLSTR